jgi:hypothetical protein
MLLRLFITTVAVIPGNMMIMMIVSAVSVTILP